jgi:hypothetical protein
LKNRSLYTSVGLFAKGKPFTKRNGVPRKINGGEEKNGNVVIKPLNNCQQWKGKGTGRGKLHPTPHALTTQWSNF